ncbi:hypothetical protein ACE01N_13410 [Saccharicrinis sp. FJH2]|uniref:hypothetical protein n=1 Tax=Saccharicrinis sp. FJH65 TaxID=3344659 RepID=UPI0035F2CACA
MFFFGAFSTLLPYVIIAVIYSVFMITLSVEKHSKSHVEKVEAKSIYMESSEQEISEDTIHYTDVQYAMSEVISITGLDYVLPVYTGNFSPPKNRDYYADEAYDDFSLFPNPPPIYS